MADSEGHNTLPGQFALMAIADRCDFARPTDDGLSTPWRPVASTHRKLGHAS